MNIQSSFIHSSAIAIALFGADAVLAQTGSPPAPLQIIANSTPYFAGSGISVNYRIGTEPTVAHQYDVPHRTFDSGYYAPRPYHYSYYSDPGYHYSQRAPRAALRSGWQTFQKSGEDSNQQRTYQPSTRPVGAR